MQLMTSELDSLKAYFDQHRKEWLDAGHGDQWVLIGPAKAEGFFDRYEQAVLAASKIFGPKPCLIQQVLEQDRIESIQHIHYTGEWAATRS